MNNTFEIINGRKYKKCKENQIRNPKTNRCINANIKDRIEYKNLLNKILNIDETNNCMRIMTDKNLWFISRYSFRLPYM